MASPAAHTLSWLPKPAELIKAEMGVVLGKLGRQLICVSMADDLPGVVRQWCEERGLSETARAKVEQTLQTRLDEALAQALQEASEKENRDMV